MLGEGTHCLRGSSNHPIPLKVELKSVSGFPDG